MILCITNTTAVFEPKYTKNVANVSHNKSNINNKYLNSRYHLMQLYPKCASRDFGFLFVEYVCEIGTYFDLSTIVFTV